MKTLACLTFATCLCAFSAISADLSLTSIDQQGNLTWTNAFINGVCTVESTDVLGQTNGWQFQRSCFTSNSAGQSSVSFSPSNRFFRLAAVDVSTNTPRGHTNLVNCYGLLRTVAGKGTGGTDNVNYWQPSFEGDFATNVALSRPHNAIADADGNIFIVDKCSHSVLKVTTDGRIHTVAGTHIGGFNGDGPAPGTTLQLNQPNGLYLNASGVVFILDTGNGKVRRLDSNGVMTTLFTVSAGITSGRGLWVADDEQKAIFCDAKGQNIKVWNSISGVSLLNSQFTDLGNLIVDPTGNVIATDRGSNTVWKVDIQTGTRTLLYGNGATLPFVDGTLAANSSLWGVRGIWPLTTDGYLLATHEGSQLIYVDAAGIGHIWLNGQKSAHAGDNQWFFTPGYKISEARSVSVDTHGNILIVENDYGYVRQIDFRPMGQ